jgi:hypothetical protein
MVQLSFSAFGFAPPKVSLASSGTSVRAIMGQNQVCTAMAGTEANLNTMVRKAIPWLSSAQIVVDPAGERLSAYVRRHCRPMELAGGQGQVVLSEQGIGVHQTKSFTVRARRWTVEYISGGRTLEILVMRNGFPAGGTAHAVGRGPGRQTISGAGTFTLQMATPGEWAVRVRDGA